MATLPTLSAAGSLTVLAPGDPFHAGDTLYVFPTRLNATGPVPGANAPTTMSPSGQGGSVFVTDVTGSATSAINGGFPSLSYAITSRFEGPLPAPVPAGHNIDCKTSYDVQLRITHY